MFKVAVIYSFPTRRVIATVDTADLLSTPFFHMFEHWHHTTRWRPSASIQTWGC